MTANPEKGEVELVVGDVTYVLVTSFAGMLALQNLHTVDGVKPTIESILSKAAAGDLEAFRDVFWALFRRHHPDMTLDQADRLIGSDEVRTYLIEIMREVLAIGRAVGVDADIDPEARIDMARVLGPFKTSMLQDLEAGKRLEIDGLLAGTLEIARKAGVRAPFTESLFGLIRARAQSTGQYR